MTDFTRPAMQRRFDELTATRSPLVAEREQAWTELNRLVSGETELSVREAKAREAELRETIKGLHAKLLPIDQEYALLAKALGAG